jgi:geranylgeranylglycerol-phosphate geranylgeranyltransferase
MLKKSDNFGILKKKIRGFFLLVRFELPFSAGICVLMGELLALGKFPTIAQASLGFLSVFFLSASTLVLNDYFDLASDKINAPHRALPAGLVTKRDVVVLSCVMTLFGFIASCMISLVALWVGILVWVVGFLYNWRLKRTGFFGNLMVSFSVGMTFIFGGITVGLPFEKIVWLFGFITMFIDLGEEVAADAMDAGGDRQMGSRSVAILWGPTAALKMSAAIFLLVIVLSSIPFWLGWLGWIYAFPILFMDGVILYSVIQLLDSRKASGRIYIRWIYLSALVAMLLFILIRMLGITAQG